MGKRIISILMVVLLITTTISEELVMASVDNGVNESTVTKTIEENDSDQKAGADNNTTEDVDEAATTEQEETRDEVQNQAKTTEQEKTKDEVQDQAKTTEQEKTKDEVQDQSEITEEQKTSKKEASKEQEAESIQEKEETALALADEESDDLVDYEVYLADYLITNGRYDFMTQDYAEGACGVYVRSGKENGLNSSLAAWRAATFDGASEVGYAWAEVGYYESILFDLVYDEKEDGVENTIYDNIMDASEAIKASNWKTICKGGQEALMNVPLSADNLEKVYPVIQSLDAVQPILGKIGDATDILGYVDTGKEFLEKISELSVLVSVSEETQDIITDLAKDYNKNDAMNTALSEYALLFEDLLDESTIMSYLAGKTTLKELSTNTVSTLWGNVITKMNSAGFAIEVGQNVGKMASNFLVSTDATIEYFYSMEAMTKFTQLLASQVRTYGDRFQSDPSVENAKKFNAAFELLYKANVINLDYAEKFLTQVSTKGFISWLFQKANDENYQANLSSIQRMKKDFNTYMDQMKALAMIAYKEEFPDDIDTEFHDVEVEKPVSDENLDAVVAEIDTISEQISDITFTEDKTFNADTEHYGNVTLEDGTWDLNGYHMIIHGDLYIKGGLLKLNGGSLTVNGNVYHTSGTLYLSQGNLDISENYWMGSVNDDGTIASSNGEIKMSDGSDLLKVAGDFYMYCNYGSYIQWTAGTTEIGGSLYKYHGSNGGNTGISENHKMIFTGEKDPTISSKGYYQLSLAHVEILNAASRKVKLVGDIGISGSLTGDSETVTVTAQDAELSGDGFSNQDLVVDSDLTYDGGTWQLKGNTLKVNGDMHQSGSFLNTGGSTIEVTGSYYQQNGTLNILDGTVTIGGTYYLGEKNEDGTIKTSIGGIKMSDEAGLLKVAGDFYMYCNYGSYIQWTAGTTEIGGSLYKYHSSNGNNTGISENHKMIFTGEKDLTISSKGYYQLNLAHVEILNAASRKVKMVGDIGISGSLTGDSETVTVTAQDVELSGDGFSSQNLVVDGDLTYDGGTWQVNGKSLKVNGDVYQKGGILNLGKGSLEVTGTYHHQSGTLNPSGGSIDIGKNYYNVIITTDSSSGDQIYQTTSGLLYMNNSSSSMNVGGDFIMASTNSHSDKLTAGTIMIQGDFTQISGSAYNFACKDEMIVILNGEDVQHVSFASTNSKFNILQLTKDKDTGYIFSPDPCWNELVEIKEDFAILVQPEDSAAAEGQTLTFVVQASGKDLSYQWQYCDAEDDRWKDVESEDSQTEVLSVVASAEADGRRYRCVVTNGDGETLTTEEAVLNVKYELTILQQPTDFVGKEGDTAIFSVTAAGYQLSYQWQYLNVGEEEWRKSSKSGNDSATLVVPITEAKNGQKYRCVITDGDGNTVTSNAAEITVKVENPFTDISKDQYYYEPVLWAYECGIASGITSDQFGPEEQCTRAQVVIFLWRAKGKPEASIKELPFEDVQKGTYYYDAIAWAYENNIVSGVDETHFGPDDPVTRGQFVTFLHRTEGKPEYSTDNPFEDVNKQAYYYDPVLWAYENGIASGLSEGVFGPDEVCTRGQVVAFLYRAYH